MADKVEVQVSHRFKAPPAKVYEAWLRPDQVRAWFSAAVRSMGLSGEIAEIKIVPEVGGAFLFADVRDGVEARHWGTYLDLEYPRELAFTWNTVESDEFDPNKVVIEIKPDGGGSMVTLTNEFGAKWAGDKGLAEKGWNSILKAADELLGG